MKMGSKSALYTGAIRHRRFVPITHSFNYPIFMMYLDLDEIDSLFSSKWYCSLERFNLVSFKRKDYFNPEVSSLKQAVIDRVENYYQANDIQLPAIKAVRMLGHVRYFGYNFNPVVFYYCFDTDDQIVAILSEITNTPWGERHSYVHPIACYQQFDQDNITVTRHENNSDSHKFKFEFRKQFHVSPFNPMNMDYRWVFSEAKQSLHVHMDNFIQNNEGEKHFDATLTMKRQAFEKNLASTLIQQPLLTVKVVWGIYWQALKLWVKRSPFYDHPNEVLQPDLNKGLEKVDLKDSIQKN